MHARVAVLACGLSVALWPVAVPAANGVHVRTPPIFPDDVPCVQTIERGQTLHVDYAVPYDDVDLTPDELPDSRSHQFFAFAQQRFDFRLPIWITQSDYDRALANGDVVEFADRPILESDPSWPAPTWVRLTPDDPRLPITMAQAAMGVDWDTTDAAPGTWLVATYTWEPEQNLWTHRFGAVRIVDPADPDATGPTVFLPPDIPPLVHIGEIYAPPGCIEALPGSTITASWGQVTGGIDPQWVEFLQDAPVVSGPLALDFEAPEGGIGAVKLRVEITDPNGRSYVAYSPTTIGVIAAASDDSTGGTATDDDAGQGDGGGASGSGSTDGTGGAGQGDTDESGGCGCRRGGSGRWGAICSIVLAVGFRRRRRSTHARRHPLGGFAESSRR